MEEQAPPVGDVPRRGSLIRDPTATDVWLVGGGIASLAAAVFLIDDAHVPGERIHILEASSQAGGSMSTQSRPSWEVGYRVSAIRKLSMTYHCLYGMLDKVPSETEGETLLDTLRRFNNKKKTDGPSGTRLVRQTMGDDGRECPEAVDSNKMGLDPMQQCKLILPILEKEEAKFEGKEIQDLFDVQFFDSVFWDLWSSLNRFQPWSSAVEFRRYLHRFLDEFSEMSSLNRVERAPENDFQALIRPLTQYLKSCNVDFRHGISVTGMEFVDEEDGFRVSQLNTKTSGGDESFKVSPSDIVLVTLGSLTSGICYGATDRPPPKPSAPHELDAPWKFWNGLVEKRPETFGNPSTFCGNPGMSTWLSFTVTLYEPTFIEYVRKWCGTQNGTVPLMTFKDCDWMPSITIPEQPYFDGQPDDVYVFWGYGLCPENHGRHVHKPMLECTGTEILIEILSLMAFPLELALDKSITISCLMPLIGSALLSRIKGDRPDVIPEGSKNLGLMGQFVEIERDVTFTMEYSVRSAQMAVYGLMGVEKEIPLPHGETHSEETLGQALNTLNA